jgi:hypothetical protein
MSLWSAVSQRVRSWFVARPESRTTFSTSGPFDALIYGVWGSQYLDAGPVSRDEAMSIAAVERGRDEICAAATLPLVARRGLDPVPNLFLDQPDPDVPKVVMLAQTLEDLLCDGVSWWQKTALDYRGFPLAARRVVNVSLQPPSDAGSPAPLPSGLDPHGASVWVDGREVPAAWMIRFDSPGRPLLEAGRRSIRKAIMFDALAAMYAQNPRPLETFTDSDNQTVVPYSDEEAEAFLASYQQSRRRGAPAWIPKQAMRSDVSAPSPAELQLVELQREVSLEIALHMGLDPEDVGVNTTSRTYFNATDRRTDKINRTLGPYMSAITDRLSMGDVTPRGQIVRFDTTEWLRPDHAALATFLTSLKGAGAIDAQEVRVAAGWSGPVPAQKPAPVAPAPAPAAIEGAGQNMRVLPAQLGPALTAYAQFDAAPGPVLRFSGRDFGAAAKPAIVDQEKRTVTGLAVPYNAVARKYGVGFRFRPGSLEYDGANLNRLRVMEGHSTYVGVHSKVEDTKDGPVVTLKVLDGPEGSPTKMARDQLLMDAAGGLVDGLSVGVDFSLNPEDGDVVWSETDQVFDVLRATWNETSLTPDPAFTGARVTRVSASNSHGGHMNCQHCQRAHPQGMSCAVAAQLYPGAQQTNPAGAAAVPVNMSATPPAPPAPPAGWPQNAPGGAWTAPGYPAPSAQPLPPGQFAQQLPPGPMSADQLTAALTGVVQSLVDNGSVAASPPQQFAQPVNAHALPLTGPARVVEPEPYVLSFDKKGQGVMARGTHDLSQDYPAVFNVATSDINEANPTRQRPDMYVDQREYQYPIWNAISKGSLSDITPFAFPKFNSASGLVAAHTEGTEPTTGSFTTTGQTITPTGYSGKARINREVWDQGGNPQISTLIWNQMVRGVFEALEAAAVTELNAGSFTAIGTLTAGNADRQVAGNLLGDQLEAGIAALQFVRGGYRFSDAFAQADLYLTLAATKATDGRARYPMINPTNANGGAEAKFRRLNLAGQDFDPAWALAASGQTAATKSYLVDRSAVHGWASPPQRLTLDQIAVAYVDLGVWGYQATAVSDTNGVRTITWDPVA